MSINPEFTLQPDDLQSFRRHGFVKLKSFFGREFIEHVGRRIPEQMQLQDERQQGFERLGYDIFDGDEMITRVLDNPTFVRTMTELSQRSLFYTQGVGFEIRQNKHHGFPWHIGSQSFGYQRVTDYGCSIWTPLVAIDPNGQNGGMSYVSKAMVSGRFMYEEVDPAIDSLLASVEQWDNEHGSKSLSIEEFGGLRHGILNDPAMLQLLEYHKQTDAFEPGDVLVFDKHVLHRSEPLHEGPIETRAAFVMRFVDIESRYDAKRSQALEFPRRYFGHAPKSNFHLNVCDTDQQLIRERKLFRPGMRRFLERTAG